MINVIIHLKKESNPKELVKFLLAKKLIASASIDENNITYELGNDGFSEVICSVITAQSKALLFNEIVKIVESKIGVETPINATPIVGSNKVFDDIIKTKIIPI